MFRCLLLALVVVLLFSACTSNGPTIIATPTDGPGADQVASTPTSEPTPTPVPPTTTSVPPTETALPTNTPTPQPYGPDNFPAEVNPLTGQPVGDPALLDRRPMMIKVQNFPRGQRPAFGVSLADIVFDSYANNGATRFDAIFYGLDAERVSPIRSARLLDISLVQMYKSIFAFGGADERILSRLNSSDFADRLIVEGSRNCPPMCRVDPNGYNYLVTNTAELSKYATANGISNKRQDLNGMLFDPAVPEGGAPGKQLFARYNVSAYVRWDYDEESGRYLRFQDAQEDNGSGESYAPFIDGLNEEQIAANNVVVLVATHENIIKRGNAEIIDIQLSGSGKAYAFRDGQAYEVNWNRPATDSVLFLTTKDGKLFPIKPGNTWYQVVGQTTQVEKQDGGAWRFTFGF